VQHSINRRGSGKGIVSSKKRIRGGVIRKGSIAKRGEGTPKTHPPSAAKVALRPTRKSTFHSLTGERDQAPGKNMAQLSGGECAEELKKAADR